MKEKFKEAVDNGNEFGALLTDLSKAFDCIDHSLLLAKLYEYVVSYITFHILRIKPNVPK